MTGQNRLPYPRQRKTNGKVAMGRRNVGCSSGGIIPSEVAKKAYKLGREIGRRRHGLITGACPGLPHEAVKGAKSVGVYRGWGLPGP